MTLFFVQVDDNELTEKNIFKLLKKQVDENFLDALEETIIPKCVKLAKSICLNF